MAEERLLGSSLLVATNTQDGIAGTARNLGWNWKTTASGKVVVAGYVKMHQDGSFVTGTKWQLWQRASPISSSILLQNIEIGGGIVTGAAGAEVAVPGVANTALTANQEYFVTIYHPSTQTGNYYYFGSGGPVTGATMSGNDIFKNGQSATTPPDDETFTGGRFAVDIGIDDAAPSHVKGAEFLPFF